MKIVHISTRDSLAGAFRATYRLHEALLQRGVDSHLLVARKYTQDPKVHLPTAEMPSRLLHALRMTREKRPLNRYPNRIDLLSPAVVSANLQPALHRLAPDVINLHWLAHGFVRPNDLRKWQRPLVWTMHDMWPFTGGCHYSRGCVRYHNSCGACPLLASSDPDDLTHQVWQTKNKSWQDLAFTAVSPSRWLADCARQSSLFQNKRVEVIPNGLESKLYRPQPKSPLRAQFGFPQEAKILLFGAIQSTSDPRKGYHLLIPALERLVKEHAIPNLHLVVVGADQGDDTKMPPIPIHFAGFINDEEKLAALYATADLFVAPSIEDNLPNTVMEALACGTPCVAFAVGGMPDMIEHQHNGYLATPLEIDDLAQGMAWVLSDDERHQRLSERARAKVLEEFTLSHMAEQYMQLYAELLQS